MFHSVDHCRQDHVTTVMLLSCHDGEGEELCNIAFILFNTYPIMTTFVGISCITFIVRGCLSFIRFLGLPAWFIEPTYALSLNRFAMNTK